MSASEKFDLIGVDLGFDSSGVDPSLTFAEKKPGLAVRPGGRVSRFCRSRTVTSNFGRFAK